MRVLVVALFLVACGGQTVPLVDDAGADASADVIPLPPPPEDAAPDVFTCDAPRTMCGDTCVDTRTDKNHCGDCSTTCSFCAMGKCGENQLAYVGGGAIAAMAADQDGVYVLTYSKGGLYGCPYAGCKGVMKLLTTVADHPYSQGVLVAGGGYVFWLDGEILTCPTSGCSAPSTFAPLSNSNVVTDGTDVFFVGASGLVSCPVTGCSSPKKLTNASATRIVLAGNDVVLVSGSSISTCAKTGCASPKPVATLPSFWTIAAGGNFVGTGAQSASANVVALDLTNVDAGVATLASAEDMPNYAVADDTTMFWADFDIPKQAVLKKCAWLGCSGAPTIIASTLPPAPTGAAYAIGGDAVAWYDGNAIRVAGK
jgi:hypothetical protein